jgi:hypothetical protein
VDTSTAKAPLGARRDYASIDPLPTEFHGVSAPRRSALGRTPGFPSADAGAWLAKVSKALELRIVAGQGMIALPHGWHNVAQSHAGISVI